jgi:hypothetical protein
MRNDGAGETDGEALGGEKEEKMVRVCKMWHYG